MSTAVVFITFVMGAILFDKRTAYVAALLLTVSMASVAIAHFATVDAAATFWYWLSCLFALLIWKRGDRRFYVLASLIAGIAIGAKVDRLVVICPIVASHFMRHEGFRFRKLALSSGLIVLGYLLANPTLLTSPFQYLERFLRDVAFSALRDDPGYWPYVSIVGQLQLALGWPLLASGLCGVGYGVYCFVRGAKRSAIGWVLSTWLPYYLIFSRNLMPIWYVPLLLPSLMVLIAFGFIEALDRLPRPFAYGAVAAGFAVVGYSLAYTGALVSQFTHDSRYDAAQWIEQNVPAGSTVEIGPYGPNIPMDRYQVRTRGPDPESHEFARKWRANVDSNRGYRRIRDAVLTVEEWVHRRLGLSDREELQPSWYDRLPERAEESGGQVDEPEPRIVAVINDSQPVRRASLEAATSAYRLVAHFPVAGQREIACRFPFVNPDISVFERKSGS
jgi:hypothetical protein